MRRDFSEKSEVTFIGPSAPLEIRMMDATVNRICEAAVVLKATHFVAPDGFCEAENVPIWGVFEMRTAEKGNPAPSDWSIRDPIKTFIAATSDAAVMYALTVAKR